MLNLLRALGLTAILGATVVGCSSDPGGGACERDGDCNRKQGSCAVCSADLLTCAYAGGHREDMEIDSSDGAGCSMTFDGKPLTVSCDHGEVCFSGGCFSQTIDNSFTFTYPKEGAVVCEPSGT